MILQAFTARSIIPEYDRYPVYSLLVQHWTAMIGKDIHRWAACIIVQKHRMLERIDENQTKHTKKRELIQYAWPTRSYLPLIISTIKAVASPPYPIVEIASACAPFHTRLQYISTTDGTRVCRRACVNRHLAWGEAWYFHLEVYICSPNRGTQGYGTRLYLNAQSDEDRYVTVEDRE